MVWINVVRVLGCAFELLRPHFLYWLLTQYLQGPALQRLNPKALLSLTKKHPSVKNQETTQLYNITALHLTIRQKTYMSTTKQAAD